MFYYNFTDKKLRPISLPITRGAADGLQTISLSNDQQRLYIGLVEGLIVYEIKPGKAIGLLESNPKYCLIQSVSPELKKINGGEYGPVPGEQELIVLATRNQALP